MDEQAAFIRKICETPEDDTVRLVFADWLQENGEEDRAEYIRWTIKGPRKVLDKQLVKGDSEWSAPCPWMRRELDARPLRHVQRVTYARGFISHIALSSAVFSKRAKIIFRTHPIESVELTDKRPAQSNNEWVWTDYDVRPTWPEADLWMGLVWELRGYSSVSGACFRYPTQDSAIESLSEACVRYGRSLAGLPPLTSRQPQPA